MEQLNTFAKEQDGKITINGTPLFAVTDFSTKSLRNNMMNVTISFDAYVVPPLVVKSSETDAEDRERLAETESATRLEITFKSGDTITYEKDQWDDYGYDGRAISVKLKGAWVGIYNFDHVFSVELKP